MAGAYMCGDLSSDEVFLQPCYAYLVGDWLISDYECKFADSQSHQVSTLAYPDVRRFECALSLQSTPFRLFGMNFRHNYTDNLIETCFL